MNLKLEKKLRKQGYRIIIGVDEAGRGPLAGPVIAAAVLLRNFEPCLPAGRFRISNFESNSNKKISNDKNWDLIKDSKKLSAKQREVAYDFIMKNFYVGVGMCGHKIIDRINILQASLLAMKKAVNNLQRNMKEKNSFSCHSRESGNPVNMSNLFSRSRIKCGMTNKIIVLVDGNKIISNLNYEQKAIVGGDRKVKSIAAASIIAKVTRDRLMLKMHRKFPDYGFDKHKGYGTKIHLQNLEKHGPSSIHRLSFRPVKK